MAKDKGQFTDEWGKSAAKERYGNATSDSKLMSQTTEEAPQDSCDKRAAGYDNNVPSNWLRGMPSAEGKPGFDHSKDGGK